MGLELQPHRAVLRLIRGYSCEALGPVPGPEGSVSGRYCCDRCLVQVDAHRIHGEAGYGVLGTWTPGKGSGWGGDPGKGEAPQDHPLLLGGTAGGMRLWWRFSVPGLRSSSFIWESAEAASGLGYH